MSGEVGFLGRSLDSTEEYGSKKHLHDVQDLRSGLYLTFWGKLSFSASDLLLRLISAGMLFLLALVLTLNRHTFGIES